MDKTSDVERLFSWLKTGDLRYREFAAEREVADAVATWPALHKAAAETGHPAEAAPPEGDSAAKERIARDRMMLPPAAAEAVRAGAPPATPPPPTPSGRLMSALGRRMQAARFGGAAGPRPAAAAPMAPVPEAAVPGPDARATPVSATREAAPDPASRERAREAAERLRDRLDAAMAVNPRPAPAPAPEGATGGRDGYRASRPGPARAAAPAPSGRGALFGGAYRSRDDEYRDASPQAPDEGRRGSSLQAVFSRLSAGRSRALRDPRVRARSMPGLGTIFGRLR